MRILFKLNPHLQQRQYEKPRWIFPIKLAMYATYLHNKGNKVVWDKEDDGKFDKVIKSENQIDIPFLQLPHADRILTDAFNPKWQNNGNFKYRPGAYIQSASHCSWGRCTFCSEKGKTNEIREVEDVISEIRECKELGAAEIFDDSATFPTGEWLNKFLEMVSKMGQSLPSSRITLGCNFRIMGNSPFEEMKQAGFRMLLFGIESANQVTLDKINKGVQVEDIIPTIRRAAECGLEPHIAGMVGYSWESLEDTMRTINLVKHLLIKGYAKTAQMSFYTPPAKDGNEEYRKYVNKFYEVGFNPEFWYNKIVSIKSMADIKYLLRGVKEGLCLIGKHI